MFVTATAVLSEIRQAEQWNPFSVLIGLALLAGIAYLVWRAARRP